ncbi:MAG: site-2 protease family protein [Gammaproteobacteria bacterium]|nr:site-2 protease family protein [Gammaproteobacteria bacterium]
MDFVHIITKISVFAIPVLLAITLHEAAHAWVAYKLGDDTAKNLGRVSLNPWSHVDILGTIVLPLGLYVFTDGKFLFGYAKPVPVNYYALNNPKRDMCLVAGAGPLSNFFQAALWLFFLQMLMLVESETRFFYEVAKAGIMANMVLFAFNLFPLLPLDGGRVLAGIAPQSLGYWLGKIEPYGIYIVLLLLYIKALDTFWLYPIITGSLQLLQTLMPFTNPL